MIDEVTTIGTFLLCLVILSVSTPLYWSSDFCSSNRSLQTAAPNNVMVILIASPMNIEYPMIDPSGGIRAETGPIEFQERLGGMLRSYYREAA